MAFDGIVTTAVTRELNDKISGGKIDKIYQPSAEEIFLRVHKDRVKYNIFISANTNHAGVYITEQKSDNPPAAPGFCMLLRKHLQGARIRGIRQVGSDRIIEVLTDATNELGFNIKYRLIAEIMGKHSNILLVNIETGKIVDCIKRISGDVNRYRQTLPGLDYISPPSRGKVSYFDIKRDDFESAVLVHGFESDPEGALLKAICGISPAMAAEIIFRARRNDEQKLLTASYDALVRIVADASGANICPCVYYKDDAAPADFHAVQMQTLALRFQPSPCDTVSEACEKYFEQRLSSNRVRQKAHDMRKSVQAHLDKQLLKKQRLSEDLLKAENSDDYRLYGELLTASLHSVKDGRDSALVLNYYNGQMMKIPLDPRYTAAKNAQRYFKKYSKAKTAVVEKKIQLEETEKEILYLDSVLTFIDNAEKSEDLTDIRAELIDNGILKRKHEHGRGAKRKKTNPLQYFTSSGKRILVGRNNKENDALTFRTASSSDIWLHTKDIPGSHVILFTEGQEPQENDIFEAAAAAAYHSKTKLSENVPVDYVRVKYVKKPAGAKPGYVIFTHNNTVYVNPSKPENTENPETPENE